MTCPECQCPEVRVIVSILRTSGNRYRRYECSDCGHRWSINSKEGEAKPRPSIAGHPKYSNRKMTDREAALILLSYEKLHEIARRTGFSYPTICDIKSGRSYRNVYQLLQPLLDPDDATEQAN